MSTDGPSAPLVIAHRGASRDCPENTTAAFDEALRQGADGIELDVQLSRDGVPVVHHDKTLARAGGGRQRVSQLDASELAGLDASARFEGGFRKQRVPTLEEVLDRYARRTRLLVEIKIRDTAPRNEELARTVARLLQTMDLCADVQLLCFDWTVLAAGAEIAPGLRRVLNMKPPPLMTRSIRSRLKNLDALSADVRTLTSRFGVSVVRAGTPLLVYTCNTPRRVDRALAAGASAVMSDRPAWLAERIRMRTPDEA